MSEFAEDKKQTSLVSAPIHVGIPEYTANVGFDYPSIATWCYGDKFNAAFQWNVYYSDGGMANPYSEFDFVPKFIAINQLWSGLILGGVWSSLFYVEITYFDVQPIIMSVTIPNFFTGAMSVFNANSFLMKNTCVWF